MAYQLFTGLNSVTDIINSLKTHLDAQGYSTSLTSITNGNNLAFTIQGYTLNFKTLTTSADNFSPYISCVPSLGTATSIYYIRETGMSMHVFSLYDQYVHFVLNRGTNFYSNQLMGMLDKRGMSYVGGIYNASTTHGDMFLSSNAAGIPFDTRLSPLPGERASAVLANIDSRGLTYFVSPNSNNGSNPANRLHAGFSSSDTFDNSLFTSTPSTYNGQTSLLRLNARAYNSGNTILRGLGSPKDVRAINMASFSPEQEIVLGSDTWVIFPAITKNGTTTTFPTSKNSGLYGYAFKKIL